MIPSPHPRSVSRRAPFGVVAGIAAVVTTTAVFLPASAQAEPNAQMTAAICIEAREKGIQEPVYQVLVYPVCNYDFTTASYQSNDTSKPLSAEGMKWFFKYYLAQEQDGDNPRLSILQAKNVKGVAPATIIAAEIDPLLSEGQAYAEKLKAAGVPVTYKMYPGVTHEFFGMGAVVDEAKQAEQLAADGLTGAFGK